MIFKAPILSMLRRYNFYAQSYPQPDPCDPDRAIVKRCPLVVRTFNILRRMWHPYTSHYRNEETTNLWRKLQKIP